MVEQMSFDELIKRLEAISNAFGCEFNEPQLEIRMRHNWSERNSRFYAQFAQTEVDDGACYIGTYGNGSTPEEAIRDYYKQIVGKKLVYRAMHPKYKREVVVV